VIRKLAFVLFISAFATPGRASDACKTGYLTTIVVQDVHGKPVANVEVRIKLSCGNKETENGHTNGQGEAIFKHALSEISESQTVFAGFNVQSLDPSKCTGDEKNKRCVIKFGGAATIPRLRQEGGAQTLLDGTNREVHVRFRISTLITDKWPCTGGSVAT
jgi:Macroglobulin domain MG4